MRKFGMVIAIARELEGVIEAFGNVQRKIDGAFPVYVIRRGDAEIYLAAAGVGEIAAAAATQYLISNYKVEAILNFGFVGALAPEFRCQQLVFVKDVVHYDFDTSLIDNVPVGRYVEYPTEFIPFDDALLERVGEDFPEIIKVRLASGDKFIASEKIKNKLMAQFDADICDMEGAAIALTANRNKVPALSVKVVSDNADENSPMSFTLIAEKGTRDCAKILLALIDELSE